MKKLFFLLFLYGVSSSVFGQGQAVQSDTTIKKLLSHYWLIEKMENNGKVMVMPAELKASMSFYNSGHLTLEGRGQVEQQIWVYVPDKNIIKLLDYKTKEDLGDLEIRKLDTKELILYNRPDKDLVYLVRVD